VTIAIAGPAQAWLPRPYPQLLRGPNHAWWRPLLSIGLAAAGLGVLTVAGVVLFAGVALASGLDATAAEDDLTRWQSSPPGLLVLNLVLAGLILVAQAAVWGGFGWRPRWVASVAGGVRWVWLVRATVVTLVALAAANAVLVVLDGGLQIAVEPNAGWYAVVVLLTTPWQAAGEEYFFRGWLSQTVGSWFASPVVSGVVGALVSAGVFALVHGEQNAWLFTDRFAFGLVASWLAWRTGGLEAGIAVHAVNNVLSFAMSVLTGSMAEVFTTTSADAVMVGVDVLLFGLTALLLDRLARRVGLRRTFTPPVRAW
jgi:membrane protease YdiL (CAAX protease family)